MENKNMEEKDESKIIHNTNKTRARRTPKYNYVYDETRIKIMKGRKKRTISKIFVHMRTYLNLHENIIKYFNASEEIKIRKREGHKQVVE